jgi:hypothetical protein
MIPTLHDIAVALGGGFNEGLALVFAELGRIRAAVPDAAGQVDRLVAWLTEHTAGKFSEEAILGIAQQLVGLVTGEGWGPPNPGSIAGM